MHFISISEKLHHQRSSVVICILALLAAIDCPAQSDHNSKDLFVVKTQSGLTIPISSTGFSVNYTSPFQHGLRLQYRSYFGLFDVPMIYYQDSIKRIIAAKFPDSVLDKTPSGKLLDFLDANYYWEIQTYLFRHYSNVKDSSQYYLNKDSSKYYLTDIGTWSKPVFINVSVTNIAKSLNQFFTPSNQPTVGIEFGFIKNSVLVFNNWKKLQRDGRSQFGAYDYDFFYSFYVNTSLINYYDTSSHLVTPTDWGSFMKFAQYGSKIYWNLYYFRWLAVSVTSNTYYGLPLESDSSYQNKIPTVISNSPLIVRTSSTNGKFGGGINNASFNQRFSISLPLFLGFLRAYSGQGIIDSTLNNSLISKMYLLPSFTTYGPFNGHWTNQLGLSFNLLTKGYGGLNSTIVQGGGVGTDFITARTHTGWSGPLFYVSGSINLGTLIKQVGPAVSRHGGPP